MSTHMTDGIIRRLMALIIMVDAILLAPTMELGQEPAVLSLPRVERASIRIEIVATKPPT